MVGRLRFLALLLGGVLLPTSPLSMVAPVHAAAAGCEVTSVSFEVNGAAAPLESARRGDHIEVSFVVPEGCVNQMTFASFLAPTPALDGSRLREQVLFSKQTGLFGPGPHTMAVDVYGYPNGDLGAASAAAVHECAASTALAPAARLAASDALRAAVRARMAAVPHERARMRKAMLAAANERGANQSGPYDATCDGSPSQNGSDNGAAIGRPCAGCVGEADDKNPPGQLPGGSDDNAGYECDRNQGVGQSNPAHTGCNSFQVDFSYSGGATLVRRARSQPPALIAAVFCVRTTPLCYLTDRTESAADET